ncbi:hypothetical protein SAMN05421812_11988 [Asanoa hainanensis]|uniref:Uncharacterized protein n=1 Tax=Asanoa hainanensis TaxID=560556 RepID=A0A239PDG7_9ACTN|nr:hypothetical protein [Asanoa hainanensis]SNT65013.1 hypothetical protein SAMN05421812_11988 [Asanoa hainanensis]
MSYPAQVLPQQPVTDRRRPPGTVRAAAGVLVVMAVGGVFYGGIGLVLMPGIVERFQDLAPAAGVSAEDINGGTTLLRGVPIAAAFVGVVSALLLAGLVVGLLRGVRAVRVATFVVCGLGLLGGILATVFGFVQRLNSFGDDTLLGALNEAHPGWWPWTSAVLSLLQVVGYFVVTLLLISPPANEYFRPAPSLPPGPTGAPPIPPPPPVDPTDWQRPDPPTTTPAAM